MNFQESFDLPINIRKFYLENISEELKEKQTAKTITSDERWEMVETTFNIQGRIETLQELKKIL